MGVTEIIIGVLLLFGGSEYLQNQKAEKEIAQLQAELQETKENYETVKGVNETNAATITTLDHQYHQCLRDLKETRIRQANYSRINQDSQLRLEELETLLKSYDWSSVRIPTGLLDATTQD